MKIEQLNNFMKKENKLERGTEPYDLMHKISEQAQHITFEINNTYHTAKELQILFSRLIGKNVDNSFSLFPPFYTDYGKNITLGKDVFINEGCCFQDQGGLEIGNRVLIGQQVVIATLNHEKSISSRRNLLPSSVKIDDDVWIGAHVTILPGVHIGKGSIIGAGAVVIKDIPAYSVAVGNPARVVGSTKEKEK